MDRILSEEETLNEAVAGALSRMTVGVFVTMIFAGIISGLGLAPVLFSGFFGYLIIFSPLAMSLYLAFRGDGLSTTEIRLWFFAFSTAMGLSLSLLFHMFTTASIVIALIGTTVSFGALALYGYFTKRDLSSFGPFLFAGVIGLIVAGIVNIFLESTVLQMALNLTTIFIFLGLTAYDMNRIRDVFWTAAENTIERLQWFAALSLYINFINIFSSTLQLFGDRE